MGSSSISDAAPAVDLAQARPFQLGALLVDPPLRRVSTGETLEPRVMQVLVALARANGAVVSRDELIRTCWDGRIVGEDSITRVIGRLRRLTEGANAGAFTIETVAKVGYRLIGDIRPVGETAPPPPPPTEERLADANRGSIRRGLWAGALAVLVVAALGAWWLLARPARYTLTIEPATSPGGSIGPATLTGFEGDLRTAAGAVGLPLVSGGRSLSLSSTLRRTGDVAQITVRLDDRRDGGTIWSYAETIPSGDDHALNGLATAVANVLDCGLAALNDRRSGIGADVTASLFRFCEADVISDGGKALARARELVSRAPDAFESQRALAVAAGWRLALADGDDPALRHEGLVAADRVMAMRPDLQEAYAARALLLPPAQTVERERLLRLAATKPAARCACAEAYLGDLLVQSGRLAEGIGFYQHNFDAYPNQPLALNRLIQGFDNVGQQNRAGQLLDLYERKHGPSKPLRWYHVRHLDPPDYGAKRPAYSGGALDRASAAADHFLVTGDPATRARAIAALHAIAVTRALELPIAATLSEIGDTAGALAMLEQSRQRGTSFSAPGRFPGFATTLLWDRRFAATWRDPGFEAYLDRAGYFAYWQASRSVPDICRAADAPPFCRRLKA